MQYGRYADTPIQTLINLGHTRYLRFIYFNYSFINFTDDILDGIYIYPQYRIVKPGTNRELGEKYNNKVFASTSDRNRMVSVAVVRKGFKIRQINSEIRDKRVYSRRNMAWYNQGHR